MRIRLHYFITSPCLVGSFSTHIFAHKLWHTLPSLLSSVALTRASFCTGIWDSGQNQEDKRHDQIQNPLSTCTFPNYMHWPFASLPFSQILVFFCVLHFHAHFALDISIVVQYLYTLCVEDAEKAEKLTQSLPPGAYICLVMTAVALHQNYSLHFVYASPCRRSPARVVGLSLYSLLDLKLKSDF